MSKNAVVSAILVLVVVLIIRPEPELSDLELLSSKGTRDDYSLTVTGTIQNNSGRNYTYVQVLFDVLADFSLLAEERESLVPCG